MSALAVPAARGVASGRQLLEVRGLVTEFHTRNGVASAVAGVDLDLAEGEIVGLVGESGSGKSVTGFSVLGLVDAPGRIAAGSVRFRGRELVRLPEEALRALRGREIAMIFQDPMMTLNPVLRVDTQMVEAILAHERVSHAAALERARHALEQVGIPAAGERLRAYPHQLSGGMRQRVVIAIALLHRPALVIADEPTTALDVTIQAQILELMQALCRDSGTALLWITHDLAILDGLVDRLYVMYAGRMVESGPVQALLGSPAHPYTRGLLDSLPDRNRRGTPLRQIPGMAPTPLALPGGCAFHPRCERATEACRSALPELSSAGTGREVRCIHPLMEPGHAG
jgi:peptide/nickel transport system ATP-binding protein